MAEETNQNVDPNETIPEDNAQTDETVSKKEFDRRVNAFNSKNKSVRARKS